MAFNLLKALQNVQPVVEALMVDECDIYRYGPPAETVDAHWNEETGQYDQPLQSGAARVPKRRVYRGKCMLYTKVVTRYDKEQAGQPVKHQFRFALIPYDAPEVLPNDRLVVLRSTDSLIQDKTYLVSVAGIQTYDVSREIELVDIEPVMA